MPPSDDDAALVLAVRGGDRGAFTALYERWIDRCFDVARRILHDDGRAAEVAQDVFVAAWQQLGSLRDPAAFGGWVLRMARNRALDRLARERRSTSVAHDAPVLAFAAADDAPDREAEAVVSAQDHQELLEAATAVLGEREASVLDLHLRHGLSAAELADELGVTTNNAHQLIFRTKKKLAGGIRAWVLVRGGRVRCDALARALDTAGVDTFGREAVTVVDRHLADCDECTRRQAAVLDPSALFAAAPLLVLSDELRATVTAGLQAAGVPVDAPSTTETPADASATPDPAAADGANGDVDALGPPMAADPRRSRRRLLALAAVVVLVLVVVGLALRPNGDDRVETATPSTTEPGTSADDGSEDEAPSTTTSSVDDTTTTEVGALPAPGSSPSSSTTAPPAADATTPSPTLAPTPPGAGPTTTVATAPPTTTPRPSTTTTTRPSPPRILSFTATAATSPGGACPPARWATTLSWRTAGATTVEIRATGVATVDGLPTAGTHRTCRFSPSPPPGGWTLVVTGPGGTIDATA
jgi:RNA polymerase sigma factor (sigma-70 family)